MRGASRRHVIGSPSRIAEESPDPFFFNEVVYLSRPAINGDGLSRLFLRPVKSSGAGYIRFSDAVDLDQFQLSEDMG